MDTFNTQLDPDVINLAKAIRQQESGGDFNAVGDQGTSKGAYQFHNDHFEKWAKQYHLDPNDFSPENQNKVAYYRIKELKDQGRKPSEIAAIWNGAKMVNGQYEAINPNYTEKVKANYERIKGGASYNPKPYSTGAVQLPQPPTPLAQAKTQVKAPEVVDDSPLHSLGKLLGLTKDSALPLANAPKNILNTAKGIAEPFAKAAASGLRDLQSIPTALTSGIAQANEVRKKPVLGQKTLAGSSEQENIGSAANAAATGFGLKAPGIAKGFSLNNIKALLPKITKGKLGKIGGGILLDRIVKHKTGKGILKYILDAEGYGGSPTVP